jgi:hypothetical protein
MDTYADDLAALDLTNAVHVGHFTGGGMCDVSLGYTQSRRPTGGSN